MNSTPASHYPQPDANPSFPKIEEAVLARWQQENAFQRSIDGRPALKPSPTGRGLGEGPHPNLLPEGEGISNEFIFYDGPPFANGLPHYGHLLTGYVKDLYARYQTMRGKRVERRFGWDCHGLPAEMGSEKELGISGRAAIQNYGIDKFNEHCRTSVMKYTAEWENYVTRQARWVDFKNDYKTMDINFMESVLWAFKQLYDKGLVYEAHRVMPYSWAAETPLSNFETKLDNSYREREDKAITVAFELGEVPRKLSSYTKPIVILAWTTTPWTLPSNLALAASKDVEYVAVHGEQKIYILSKSRYKSVYESILAPLAKQRIEGNDIEPMHTALEGSELVGLTYKPLFPYFANHPNAFRILDGSSFVTDGDGTGIVHMAPGFGEDDQKCCEANGIELVVPVDGQGKYTDEIFDIPLKPSPSGRGLGEGYSGSDAASGSPHPNLLPEGEGMLRLRGLNVIAEKNKDDSDPFNEKQIEKFGLANLRIINYLKQTGQLIKQEDFKHNYPHCWRTDMPLIYRAMPSWYVEVTKFRDRAVEINKTINWIPEHIRDGQMGHMLATAPDWSISRNRFWGTPIPVWRAKSGKIIVIGSIAELEQLSGKKVTDLHRPYIDNITITKDGEEYTRVEDVFDCWFESGSMPFAQVHYPFENKEWFEKHFPADFITEYVGQTRGWFNTLIMLSTALFDKAPFKNCICHGVMLGESVKDENTGKMVAQKLSKRLKNYPEPFNVFNEYGADALRWFLVSSSVMRGNDLQIDKEGKFIRDVVRLAIKPIWNAYNFFCLYANADGIVASSSRAIGETGISSSSMRSPTAQGAAEDDNLNIMDRYILAKCAQAVEVIRNALDAYDTPAACDALTQFFDVLNNWYIRRSKERFWAEEKSADKQAAYDTLYTVLETMCRAAAPLLPLTLDEIYRGLKPSPSGRGLGEGFYDYQPEALINNARELRKNQTDAEAIVWSILRNRQLAGLKFRRQHPVGRYVLDFYCDEIKLAIELDGGQHATQQNYDEQRSVYLKQQGISIVRFWNNDVLENIDGVVETLLKVLSALQPSPNPLPEGEGFSVHLADFPDVSAWPEDQDLIAQMDWVQDVCNAALAIRNKVNIRVRQPLQSLKIIARPAFLNSIFNNDNDGYATLSLIILQEVNVKTLHRLNNENSLEEYATLKLSINSQVLGKRLPAKMKEILPASKKGEWKQVDGTVEICGEKLLAGEYTLQLEPKPDYKDRAQALSTNDALVILDTTITPELEAEGIARDMVRAIQQARKDAALHVSDRIALHIDAPEAISKALAAHKDYVMEQTLSTLMDKKPTANIFSTESEIDDKKVMISIAKAA